MMDPQLGAALEHYYTVLAGLDDHIFGLDQETQSIRRELGIAATQLAEWAARQDWQSAAAYYNSLTS